MSYLITITAVSFGYERVPHCVGRPIEENMIYIHEKGGSMIATCGRRARPKLKKSRRPFCTRKANADAREARPSLGMFFLLLLTTTTTMMMMMMMTRVFVDRRKKSGRALRTRVEEKFEIRNPVFSLYHVRDDPIPPRVRGQCSMRVEKEEPAIVSMAIGINLSGRSIDRQLLSSPSARQRPSECDRDRENRTR